MSVNRHGIPPGHGIGRFTIKPEPHTSPRSSVYARDSNGTDGGCSRIVWTTQKSVTRRTQSRRTPCSRRRRSAPPGVAFPPYSLQARLSRVVLVLTLSMASKEGHPAYRSQSDNPLQGTTLGGSPDDPRRQRTRNAPAGHATRAGTRQRQRGLPGAGDLAHPVLPVAEALRALWGRRRASEAAARAPWAPGAGAARDRTVGAQRGDQHGDLGLRADRGVPHPWLAAQSRAEHGAAGLAASRLGHASRAADGARAPGGADRRAADRAHAPAAVARALRADAPRRGHRAGGAGLSGHLLHRQSQGGRQGLADHGLRRRELLWRGGAAADPHGGRCRRVLARRPRAALSPGGLAPAARPDRRGPRVPRSLR